MSRVSGSRSWWFALAFAGLFTSTAAAQQAATITGQVTAEAGAPLDLATVFITEMNIAVTSDAEGRYTINIPAERVRGQGVILRVRRIGFVPQERAIVVSAGSQSHDFQMQQDINRLTEIVVTGVSAGTEARKVPFAVTTLSTEEMPVASSNALTQLQAKVPGAQIVMPSGAPGQAPSIVIRGPKSLDASGRSQGPLVIVDGVIIDGGTQDLNPHDIESIEIVKGAAGSSIYGSRAGSGVIQITTKSGQNAAPGVRFRVRNESGFSDIQGRYPYATRHMMMMDETMTRFCVRDGSRPLCSRTIDWEEETLRVNEQGGDWALSPLPLQNDYGISNAPPRQHLKGLFQVNYWPKYYDPVEAATTNGLYNNTNVDMSGRFGSTGFFASVSHEREEGAIQFLRGAKRSTARVNLDHLIGEEWSVQLNTFFSKRTTYPAGGAGSSFFRLTRQPPIVDLLRRDANGRLFIRSTIQNQGGQNQNPLYPNENFLGESQDDRYLGSLTARYTPMEWLEFSGTASIDRRLEDGWSFFDKGYRHTSPSSSRFGGMSSGSSESTSYNIGLSSTAWHEFTPDLRTSLNVRYTFEEQHDMSFSASGENLAVPGLIDPNNLQEDFGYGGGSSLVRAVGASVGGDIDYKDRYIVQTIYRYDGSSLFGEDERWHPYYRGSLAWRVAEESFWPWADAVNELKLRASVGTAGGRPRFVAQYETVSVGSGGSVTGNQLGNKALKPEYTTETEFGIDAEILGRYGLTLTYARAITKDQIFLVPQSVSTGFASQWQNAGTLDGKTWELSLMMPFVSQPDFSWTSRLTWDRTRTHITELGVPPFFDGFSSTTFKYEVGELIGTIYGKQFVMNCSQLDPAFQNQCGPGQEFQHNDEGFIVWVGAGNSYAQGITDNLWQATRYGCVVGGEGTADFVGAQNCVDAGGTVNAPWGVPAIHWGMPIVIRNETASPELLPIGNTLPDYRVTMSHNVQWRRFNLYALVDRSFGNELMNQELHWSLGDFMVDMHDQGGKSVEAAKPLGYYWRAPSPDHPLGVGGLYDVLGGNNVTVQDGSYTKLRELSLSYHLGALPGLGFGDWNLTVTGRNLYTWTNFHGWDPEVGGSGGNLNSSAIGAVAGYQYPPRRTFSFTLNAGF